MVPEAAAEAVTEAAAEAVAEAVAVAETIEEAVAEVEADTTNPPALWSAPLSDTVAELPLPERYNVDEIVAIGVDPTTIYLYWEVRPTSFASARARRPEGELVVRLVLVTPSWDGPLVEQRDLRTDALYGDAYVRGVRPGSNARVGVGWLAHGSFEPFAIGAEVTTSRIEPAKSTARKVGRWTPDVKPAATPEGPTADEAREPWHVPPHASELAAQLGATAPRAPSPARLGDRFPTFDLGDVGAKGAPRKEAGQTRGGASEMPRGGASDQVRPGER